ncbi:DNA alkylation repair protein [Kaistella antarctica]|uniref:DNA alkylation repair enzyme n=1 Tax=Kaistella antarctica TaxID=266748 RepID=A0A3S4UN17_9FLAO|nr:DNA alkylation repair protein [Kaistella antarctica]KEY17978.1 DNA alkylation repair protein [Kaistella antarctica]SEV81824.1 3-methyladenine DNA glycosylase AlkD [Kaistella antarctica]VEI00432.1 DNA alkylation repair enzyme [Kaistella antarctica]
MAAIVSQIEKHLQSLSNLDKREIQQRFFKTGKGEYAEGDQFIGVTVPNLRLVAKEFRDKVSLAELQTLIDSPIHEYRHCALLILVSKFEQSKDLQQKKHLVDFYLSNKHQVNNWDLVDTSCYKILGRYCFEIQDDSILLNLAEEENLWSKRIAVVSTMFHVKKASFDLLKKLVIKNLNHEHDLMHKANGWLLREMGKKDEQELLDYLNLHYLEMPRTTLRYAIERLDENLRQDYLHSKI